MPEMASRIRRQTYFWEVVEVGIGYYVHDHMTMMRIHFHHCMQMRVLALTCFTKIEIISFGAFETKTFEISTATAIANHTAVALKTTFLSAFFLKEHCHVREKLTGMINLQSWVAIIRIITFASLTQIVIFAPTSAFETRTFDR
jgi:hypothetical protein